MTGVLIPSPRHPAKVSATILDVLADLVPPGASVLDPFAGTGRVHELEERCGARTIGIELEPEWAGMHPRTAVGDATALPLGDGTFDTIVTSPCYGNRLADHHKARDGSVRHSYTHDLGRPLHPHNAGAMHWGEPYRMLHRRAWAEVRRVLRPGGMLLLNISDHIRRRAVVPVTAWHLSTLADLGFTLAERHQVSTPRLRYGVNATARVDCETVAVLRKPKAAS